MTLQVRRVSITNYILRTERGKATGIKTEVIGELKGRETARQLREKHKMVGKSNFGPQQG